MAANRNVYDESMQMAKKFSWDNDWPNAVRAYRSALQEFPGDAPALIGLGTVYAELDQYQSAIRAVQRVLSTDSGNQEALLKMGELLHLMDQPEQAIKTYLYSASVYSKAGQLNEAVEVWQKVVEIDPNQIQARNYLAQTYAKLGNPESASEELITIAIIFQENGDEAKAGQYLQGASRLSPNNKAVGVALKALQNGVSIRATRQDVSQINTLQAEVEGKQAKDEGVDDFFDLSFEVEEEEGSTNPREDVEQVAMEELANILFEDASDYENAAFDKTQIDVLVSQAIGAQTRGDLQQAIETYEKIVGIGFKRPSVHFVLGILYLKNEQFEEGVASFSEAKKEVTYALGVNYALGEIYKRQNKAGEALKYFVEVLRIIDMKNARRESTQELNQLYQELVNTYTRANNPQQTMEFVTALVKFLSSKNYERKIAEARQRLGDNGDSVSSWVEFLEAPNTEVILEAMSDTSKYMQNKMFMTAIEASYRAIQKSPAYLPLHLRVAEIFLKQDKIDKAIKKYLAVAGVYHIRGNMKQEAGIYRKVLKVAPMDVDVRTKLIELYHGQNNIDAVMEQYLVLADAFYQLAQIERSLEKYREALALAPQTTNPNMAQVNILRHMGDIYNQRVEWEQAIKMYEQLVRLAPDDDQGLISLIDLYFKRGYTSKALAALDKMMATYMKSGRRNELIEYMNDLTQLRPNERALHERLGALYTHLGMRKEAIGQYDILGELQLEIGLRDDAARTIEKIIQLGPEDPSGYEQLLGQIRAGI